MNENAKNTLQLRLRGDDGAIKSALAEVEALQGVDGVSVLKRSADQDAANVLAPGRYNQVEMVEVVVAIVINLATAAGYDVAKDKVMKAIKGKRGVEQAAIELEPPKDDGSAA